MTTRATNAAHLTVPLAALLTAVALTATVLYKLDSVATAKATAVVAPLEIRLTALERELGSLQQRQEKIIDDLQDIALELGRTSGRLRAASPPANSRPSAVRPTAGRRATCPSSRPSGTPWPRCWTRSTRNASRTS